MNEQKEEMMIARVAKVVDNFRLVINKGAVDHVGIGDVFLIYEQIEDITDPVDDTFLGPIEVIKGRGKVIHTQERVALLESFFRGPARWKKPRRTFIGSFGIQPVENEEMLGDLEPFKAPRRGDYAKQV